MRRDERMDEALPRQGSLGDALGSSLLPPGPASVLLRLAPLVLVLPPLVTFLLARPSDERLMSLVPALAGFVAVVAWAVLASRPALTRRALVAGVLLSVLAVVVLLADARGLWLTLFYYPAVAAGLIGPVRHTSVAVAAVAAVAATTGWAAVGDPLSALEFALECVLLGIAALAVSRLIVSNRELVAARAEVARLAAADERARIARDLHDLLGHGLSLIAIKAELARRLLARDAERAAAEVGDIESVSRRALEDVRAAVSGYRRVTLASELIGAQSVLETAGIAVEIDHAAEGLSDELDEALAWSVREGVTNIIRHSSARRATLRTALADAGVRLEIRNDGHVPRPARPTAVPGTVGGTGLMGLAERVAAVGGRVEAGPDPDGDFRLLVVIPVAAEES
jgi:two-component system sensor histidine kinase DesK